MSDRPRRRPVDPFLPVGPVVFDILLALSDEERHGYGILQEVAVRSRGATVLRPGTLYRALARLLEDGLIEETEERPAPDRGGDERRRYYRLTALGQDVAEAEARRLADLLRTARAKKVLRKAEA
jgi:DNA-binding PadR family transcriptional regulator